MTQALKPYLARSAGLHAAALAALALLAPRAARLGHKVYMIDFVGSATLSSAGPGLAAERGAGDRQDRAAPQADPDAVTPKGRREFALPRPSLLKGWTQTRELAPPSLTGPMPADGAGEPGAGRTSGGSAGVSTDLPNFPYPWYISQIRLMLWQAWQRRMPASPGEGVVVFAILRNGSITDLRMESSSGEPSFDEAALGSAQAAAPFPALPSDFAEPFLKIHLTLKSEPSWR